MTPGDGHLPVAATSVGRVAAAICFDADFPEYVRAIGRATQGVIVMRLPTTGKRSRVTSRWRFPRDRNGVPMVRAGSSVVRRVRRVGPSPQRCGSFSGARTMVAQIAGRRYMTLSAHRRPVRVALHRRCDARHRAGSSHRLDRVHRYGAIVVKVRRSDVRGLRANEPAVAELFEAVRGPAGDAADGERRREEIRRQSQPVQQECRVKSTLVSGRSGLRSRSRRRGASTARASSTIDRRQSRGARRRARASARGSRTR